MGHSSAHTADALCSLAESKFIKYEELMEMLDIIKDKICVDTYTYINEEEERLINLFICIYSRNIIKNEEFINWIYSFADFKSIGKYPAEEHLRENRKIFLRGLIFRDKKFKLDEKFINAVEEVLDKLPAFY